jgi:hypothetical protein
MSTTLVLSSGFCKSLYSRITFKRSGKAAFSLRSRMEISLSWASSMLEVKRAGGTLALPKASGTLAVLKAGQRPAVPNAGQRPALLKRPAVPGPTLQK